MQHQQHSADKLRSWLPNETTTHWQKGVLLLRAAVLMMLLLELLLLLADKSAKRGVCSDGACAGAKPPGKPRCQHERPIARVNMAFECVCMCVRSINCGYR